ncbi:MAG: formate hydrogenase [Leptospiraceae bacterium]|nr:formate hydrogenase [Leptospiraceae bacterium]MBK9498336.1 formate hydrogenase [Leptospiraceae bacterium]
MNIIHAIVGISLFLPIPFGLYLERNFLGEDFPILFGLLLQGILGNIILFYVRGYEHKNLNKIFFGYFIFFLGLSGSYLSGKNFLLLFFWEISTVGAIFIYLGGPFTVKGIRSIVALFLASSISMVLLCVWIFLPDNDPTGFYFLLFALLIKSAFSGLHLWLPEAHSGPPAHGSATYSGLMINLPFILFLRYSPTSLATFGPIEFLIFFSGLGIFLGGISSFFHSDLKKTLAYSTVENSNFLWLNLLISKFWMGNENPILSQLGYAFLILFYITLTHHSISKIYQFLSFGYLAKLGGSTNTDECKGIGRISGLPFLASSMGSLSFAMIPGTVGFLSESTFLYLTTVVIDLPLSASTLILPALVFICTGLVVGSAAHLKLFLTLLLSVPRNPPKEQLIPSPFLSRSLSSIGILILAIPILIWIPFYSFDILRSNLSSNFIFWIFQVSGISILVIAFGIIVFTTKFSHKIKTRQLWDCGSQFRGHEVSIPGSVISDPMFETMGKYLQLGSGESRIDSSILNLITRILNLGRFWSKFFETGDLSTYLFLSAVGLLFSIGILLAYQSFLGVNL